MSKPCVWVVEIAILHATKNIVASWEIWEAFNTRGEAVGFVRTNVKSGLDDSAWRIRKYVPVADEKARKA